MATVPALDGGAARGGDGDVCVRVVSSLDEVVRATESGRVAAAAIDIPIGLAAAGPRACDREARRLLGPRRSSVFPAPVRAVLGATSYADACALSREHSGKAVSKQLYNILDKIREVDDVAARTPGFQPQVSEACPELSFAVMSGGSPMRHSKRTPEGSAERIAVLHDHLGLEVASVLETRPAGTQTDDVLDALALAWTARRCLAGACLRLGSETDATGLRMEVVA